MRYFALVLVFLLFPFYAQAACSVTGYTVVFINGIWDTKADAQSDLKELQSKLKNDFDGQSINYVVGYNESHLAGAGDLIETRFPAFDQQDLETILMQMHDQVQTRKLLIVGHSQGAVYANKIYEYLVAHGEPVDSVAVYAVATPDSYVAGGGKYATYALDDKITVISKMFGLNPLPENITVTDIPSNINVNPDTINGHSFVDTYLKFFSDKLVSDMNTELWLLRSEPSEVSDGCFDPPTPSPLYNLQKGALTSADPIVSGIKIAAVVGYQAASVVLGTTGSLASLALGSIASLLPKKDTPAQTAANDRAASDVAVTLVNALNLTSLTPKANDELLGGSGKNLGGAAILAFLPDAAPSSTGEVFGAATTTLEDASTTAQPGAPVPIPQPAPATPGDAYTSNSSQGASPSIAASAPPPFVLLPPSNIVFSNWIFPIPYQAFGDNCIVTTDAADVSWDPVPGATSYQLWRHDAVNGDREQLETTDTHASSIALEFGPDYAPIDIEVVATDGTGNWATTTVSATDAVSDKTGPIVVSTTPAYNATDVPSDSAISITYTEPLNPVTVLPEYYRISHEGAGSINSASVSLSADGKTVILIPETPLEPGNSYQIIGACKPTDFWGNPAQEWGTNIAFLGLYFTIATSTP